MIEKSEWTKKRMEDFSRESIMVARQILDWAKQKKNVAIIGLDRSGRLAVFSVNEALKQIGYKPGKSFFFNFSYPDSLLYKKTYPRAKRELAGDRFKLYPRKMREIPDKKWALAQTEDTEFFISRYVKQHLPELRKFDGIVILDDWALDGKSLNIVKQGISSALPKAEVKTAVLRTSEFQRMANFQGGVGGWYALEMDTVAPIKGKETVLYLKGKNKKAYLIEKDMTTRMPEKIKTWANWRERVRKEIGKRLR